MVNVTKDVKFNITPKTCGDAEECIEVMISGEQNLALYLTPQQARAMASDLIQTVYRAEVKNSLQNSQRKSIVNKADMAADKFSLHTPHAA